MAFPRKLVDRLAGPPALLPPPPPPPPPPTPTPDVVTPLPALPSPLPLRLRLVPKVDCREQGEGNCWNNTQRQTCAHQLDPNTCDIACVATQISFGHCPQQHQMIPHISKNGVQTKCRNSRELARKLAYMRTPTCSLLVMRLMMLLGAFVPDMGDTGEVRSEGAPICTPPSGEPPNQSGGAVSEERGERRLLR